METKMTIKDWPILIVSGQYDDATDDGVRLRELVDQLESVQECSVIPSRSYEDAAEIFKSREDLGCVVIDWDIPDEQSEQMHPQKLVDIIRQRNKKIPVVLLTDHLQVQDIADETIAKIDATIWKNEDTPEFLAGRIEVRLEDYIETVYPVFFGALVEYAEKYKYAWHTPGHLGGTGFMRSPAGVAFHTYFGENMFRSDLSVSVPELGSLLDHSGVTGDAEKNSARVFGADQTYYVLNGTSTANQIIWHSQVVPGQISLVDRNCHKSLNYGMCITGANPVYMVPRRNIYGIIGPVRLSEFTRETAQKKIDASPIIPAEHKHDNVRMSALTNSTYDGVCYNAATIKKVLDGTVENMHFDEAWYAYAHFHPIYKDHYGMAPTPASEKDVPIFVSQSTHKLLTAFSQASMIHIKDGAETKIDPSRFNEAFMMHSSTSPQYNMVASLDVATKMMDDNGEIMWGDILTEACGIRQKIAAMHSEYAAKGDWFFGMWQPETVNYEGKEIPYEQAPIDYMASHQEPWVLRADQKWHGFDDIEEDYVMLDPIKLTITCPGIDADTGELQEIGIPGSIVTNFLINHGIVNEKTDYYSFLLLNSLGTTRAKQGTLLAALMKFKQAYDANAPLEEVFPDLVASYPEAYAGKGLKDHAQEMHTYIREHQIMQQLDKAFQIIPDQVMNPAHAYDEVVAGNVEFVWLDEMDGRVPSVMMVPYPPGIPIIMGGEILNEKAAPILQYLKERETFEQIFPGYESDIHGVERGIKDGKVCFKTLCITKDALA